MYVYLFVGKLDLVEDEHERYPCRLGFDEEPGERGRLRPRLVQREEHDELVDVCHGRVGNLAPALEHVLDHPAAVGPVDGPDEHPIPDEHGAADLLEQRPDHAEKVGAAVVLDPRRGGAHDEPSRWREQLVEATP